MIITIDWCAETAVRLDHRLQSAETTGSGLPQILPAIARCFRNKNNNNSNNNGSEYPCILALIRTVRFDSIKPDV